MVKCGDLVLKVPPGTIIKSVETEEVLADLVEEGQRAVMLVEVVEVVEIHVLQPSKSSSRL